MLLKEEKEAEKVRNNIGVLAFWAISILLGVGTILLILKLKSPRDEAEVFSKAATVTFSEELVEGFIPGNCFSESFYATKEDKNVLDRVKLLSSRSAFRYWFEETCDIRQTYPEKLESTMGYRRIAEGYVALVTSVSDLQSSENAVLIKGVYRDGQGKTILRLGTVARNPACRYDQDPATRCRQVYTIFYFKPEEIREIQELVFAIERENCEETASDVFGMTMTA